MSSGDRCCPILAFFSRNRWTVSLPSKYFALTAFIWSPHKWNYCSLIMLAMSWAGCKEKKNARESVQSTAENPDRCAMLSCCKNQETMAGTHINWQRPPMAGPGTQSRLSLLTNSNSSTCRFAFRSKFRFFFSLSLSCSIYALLSWILDLIRLWSFASSNSSLKIIFSFFFCGFGNFILSN